MCSSAPIIPAKFSLSSTFDGRCSVRIAYFSCNPKSDLIVLSLAFSRFEYRLSIITFPTLTILSSATPSALRFSSPSGEGVKSKSATESVKIRFISSGISRSKERKPASTWAQGIVNFAQTIEHATVELTSPTTTTMLGSFS